MSALKLTAKLVIYYATAAALMAAVFWLFPTVREFLPVGRVQALIDEAGGVLKKGDLPAQAAHVKSLGASIVWLFSASLGALVAAFPTSWVYMEIRSSEQYDQSLVDTIVILPLVVTGIVVIVQNSLALSFSLAGIAGAARFRNTLKSSGDLLFILLAIGIGLSAGIGAMELAFVMSVTFNLCFVLLWSQQYGERQGMKRFLNDIPTHNHHQNGHHQNGHHQGGHHQSGVATLDVTAVTVSTVLAKETDEED